MTNAIDEQGNASPFLSFTKRWHTKPYSLISPERPELSVAGKNVVVAGGGSGIGKATSIAFAQAGAKSISILGRRANLLEEAADAIRKANNKTLVLTQSADMAQRSATEAAFKTIAENVGKIDIFIWCAGVLPAIAPVKGYDEQEFRRGFELIVIGAFNAVQAFLPYAAPDATLLNVSSGFAHINPVPGMFNYSTYKAAVVKVFDYVAAENPDLRVFQTQPGVVDTEMNRKSNYKAQDEPELPAHFHVWLVSSEAAFLRNKYVWVNWDVEELIVRQEEIEKSMALRIILEGVPM